MTTQTEMMAFSEFFNKATGFEHHDYQVRLACGDRGELDVNAWFGNSQSCKAMLIDIPTGFGKTSAVVLAWIWNRVIKQRGDWPRRLVYCLPMRTLVEQTRDNVDEWLKVLELADKIHVHTLMGGEEASDWDTHPERNAVLIGTQDMLLSRALNRGYGMSRYRWPIHFGLLNNDCLWVMDEVQLMGPGLWTSSQLDWMRNERFEGVKPCVTWWMSATISTSFLDTLDRKNAHENANLPLPTSLGLNAEDLNHPILQARRPCRIWNAPKKKKNGRQPSADGRTVFRQALAEAVIDEHLATSLTLIVCNTITEAQEIYNEVIRKYKGTDDVVLLTSRFRPADRERNQHKLLDFEAARKRMGKNGSTTARGLICVSTQVIEAGVDVSARRLWSELAPWPSIIQRLGRLNRDGRLNEEARAYFWEREKQKRGERLIGPYEAKAVDLGKQLLREMAGYEKLSARKSLEILGAQKENADKLKQALTLIPETFPRAIDVHGLFSTEPNVFGGFTDVSPFIRSQDKNSDVTVFWRKWSSQSQLLPEEMNGPVFHRNEGCPVTVGKLREFLNPSGKAWVWDDKTEKWQDTDASGICPGMLVMLRQSDGGYSDEMGWTGGKNDKPDTVPPPGEPYERFKDDRFSESGFWVKLGDHLQDAKNEATRIVEAIGLNKELGAAVIHASSEHDIGKALPEWQGELPKPTPQSDMLWAKAPYRFAVIAEHPAAAEAVEAILRENDMRFHRSDLWAEERTRYEWHTDSKVSRNSIEKIQAIQGILKAWNVPFRPGMRHEAATALALWHSYYRQRARNFTALSIYLAAAHHGKVRTVLKTQTVAGNDVCGIPKTTNSLMWNNMPLDFECAIDGASGHFSEDGSEFIFEAPGWTGLVTDLLGGWEDGAPQAVSNAVPDSEPRNLGPFGLAYLEALVRCADEQASKDPNTKKDIDS